MLSANRHGTTSPRYYTLLAAAFLLGLTVGGMAFGERPVPLPATPGSPPRFEPDPTPPAAPTAMPPRAAERPPAGPDLQRPDADAGIAGPMSLSERVDVLTARWSETAARLQRLQQRVDGMARELAVTRDGAEAAREERATPAAEPQVDPVERRRRALLAAGVPTSQAEDILWRRAERDLERLDLQDQALREGWFGTERYYEQIQALAADEPDLQSEIGAIAYDRYLFETGVPNRVQINAVIPGSAAEQAGLLPGDIVETYDGSPVFSTSDLRQATTAGERGEPVTLTVRRGDQLLDAWVTRGPVGVQLESALVSPRG